jgi:hypothetical protein
VLLHSRKSAAAGLVEAANSSIPSVSAHIALVAAKAEIRFRGRDGKGRARARAGTGGHPSLSE